MRTVCIFTLTSLLATASIASADIGFAKAISLCRGAVPQGTLLGIEQRERNNVWVYQGDMYDAALTTNWGPRFNRETGAALGVDVDTPDEKSLPNLEAIFARLSEAVLDFSDALPIANEAAGREDVMKIAFDLEAGILAFQVEYFDEVTKIYVDSVTGGVIPHHGAGDDVETTASTTSLQAGVALAEAALGAGWNSFKVEAEQEDAGAVVQVLLFNIKSGMLAAADGVGGAVTTVTEFEPIGTQAEEVAALQANWADVQTGLSAALAAAEAAYPACGVNEVEFEVETEKTGTELFWKIGLVTADLIEVDFFVDATAASGGGFRFATAPINGIVGDVDGDGAVTAFDLSQLLGAWGAINPPMDLDHSGQVDAGDMSLLLANWR
jgi:hypothetical protein